MGKKQAQIFENQALKNIKSTEQNSTTAQKGKCNFELNQVRYNSVYQTVQQIYQKEGIKAFGKGIYPRMCINVPSTALSWGTYEIVKGMLTKE